jgi:hypothetical protein
MCDNDLLQMLAINIPQRWMRATFSWLTRASDQATLTLAHCNLETMGMYTRTSISTKDVKLNLEQIQKPEPLQPLKPSETYLVTSCHYLLSFRYAKAPAQAHAPTSPTRTPLYGFDPVECLGRAIGDST